MIDVGKSRAAEFRVLVSGIYSSSSNRNAWSRSLWMALALISGLVTVIASIVLIRLRLPPEITQANLPIIGIVFKDVDKAWVLLLWLCTATMTAVSLLVARSARSHLSRGLSEVSRTFLAVTSVIGLVAALLLAMLTGPTFDELEDQWHGFGVAHLIVGIGIAIVFLLVVRTRYSTRKVLMFLSVAIVVAAGILPLIQTPFTFDSIIDNKFTLEELLAPSAGRMAGFDYINQYEVLLAYPLAFLHLLFPAWFTASAQYIAVGWMILLQIGSIAAAVWGVIRVSPRRFRWIVPILVVPIVFLPGKDGLPYYADLPIRTALPALLFAAIVFLSTRSPARRDRWWAPAAIGLIAGAAALNNLDFGVPAALAAFIVLVVAARGWATRMKAIGLFALGAFVMPAIYLGAGFLSGRTFNPSYFFYLVVEFGAGGFLNVDMLTLGLHLTFVFLGVVGVVLGALGTRGRLGRARALHLALFFSSSWLVLSLIYYSGRSLTPTLVTSSSFGAAIVIGLLAVLGMSHLRLLTRNRIAQWTIGDVVTAALAVLVLSLPFAAWTSFPSIDYALDRITTPKSYVDNVAPYLQPSPVEALAHLPAGTDLGGFIANSDSYWHLVTGATDASLFLQQSYFPFAEGANYQCRYMASLPGKSFLLTGFAYDSLRSSAECQSILDFTTSKVVWTDHSEVLTGGSAMWTLLSKR